MNNRSTKNKSHLNKPNPSISSQNQTNIRNLLFSFLNFNILETQNISKSTKKHKKWNKKLVLDFYMEGFIKKASNHSFTCKKCEKETKIKLETLIFIVKTFIHIYCQTHTQKKTLLRKKNLNTKP